MAKVADAMVSIIIPIYRVEKYLHRCLDSVLAQDYPDWEAILVDDGSPDRSGEIADEYVARDGRFQVIHQENSGLSAARNRGMAAASGRYLMFMDSDDWWPDGQLLSKLVAEMQRGRWDIINFGIQEHTRDGVRLLEALDESDSTEEIKRKMYYSELLETVWNKIYLRTIWAGIAFPEGRIIEDFYVMPEVFARAERIRNWGFPGYAYNRLNETSIIATVGRRRFWETVHGVHRHLDLMEQGVLPNTEKLRHFKYVQLGVGALMLLRLMVATEAERPADWDEIMQVAWSHRQYLPHGRDRLKLWRLRYLPWFWLKRRSKAKSG